MAAGKSFIIWSKSCFYQLTVGWCVAVKVGLATVINCMGSRRFRSRTKFWKHYYLLHYRAFLSTTAFNYVIFLI